MADIIQRILAWCTENEMLCSISITTFDTDYFINITFRKGRLKKNSIIHIGKELTDDYQRVSFETEYVVKKSIEELTELGGE